MEKGLIVLMVLILWGPAVLYLGYRFIKALKAPADGQQRQGQRGAPSLAAGGQNDIAADPAQHGQAAQH